MNHCACTKEYTIKKISNSFKHSSPLGENGKIEQGTNMLQHKIVEPINSYKLMFENSH